MPLALLAFGSNLGNCRENLEEGVRRLARVEQTNLRQVSRWHATRPVGGPGEQPAFLNGAAVVATELPPRLLLAALREIEEELGRTREIRWGARTLDLDLILYDQHCFRWDDLEIPHPRAACRRFVLEPAAEVAPAWVHPPTGWTLARLAAHLRETEPCCRLVGGPAAALRAIAEEVVARTAWRLAAENSSEIPTAPRITLHLHAGGRAQLPQPSPGADDGPTLHLAAEPLDWALREARAALEGAE